MSWFLLPVWIASFLIFICAKECNERCCLLSIFVSVWSMLSSLFRVCLTLGMRSNNSRLRNEKKIPLSGCGAPCDSKPAFPAFTDVLFGIRRLECWTLNAVTGEVHTYCRHMRCALAAVFCTFINPICVFTIPLRVL